MPNKLLNIKDLTIKFAQRKNYQTAVSGLEFSVFRGESLGIVGESGSGKSVTAMSITRLLHPSASITSGSIIFEPDSPSAFDLLKADDKTLRRFRGGVISIIFQEPMSSLNPILSCGNQVAEAMMEHKKAGKSDVRQKVCSWFEKVGLSDSARIYDAYPHQLSGGQLQRVLIALALCCEPALVIADEPTTALDVHVQKKILDLLMELKKELGLTLIFISHDLGIVHYLCDRILVLKEGKKIEENDKDVIFRQPSSSYTRGLMLSRPPLRKKLRVLPTVDNAQKGEISGWFDDANIINRTEQDRKATELSNRKKIISVRGLQVGFPVKTGWFGRQKDWHHILNGIDLDVHKGEVVGLVGESGSGKTTLGRSILGLSPVSRGEIFYDDIPLHNLDVEDWRPLRKKLQIIFQDPYSSLNPRKTVGDSITGPVMVHRIAKNRKDAEDIAAHMMVEVGLSADHLSRYPHQFSGGQRQRICIARALSLQPEFIVCDESVSALDVSVQAQILNLLMDLKSTLGLSFLFITHDLAVVHFMADRILVLNKGVIVEEGKPYQIIDNPAHEYTRNLVHSVME